MEPNQNQNVIPPVNQNLNPTQENDQTPPINNDVLTPKKTFPKWAIWSGIGVVLLIIIFIVIRLFRSSGEVSGEITWWGLWEDESLVSSLITEYQEKNPNVKITYVKQSPKDYRERLTNAFARGQGPDIFRFHNSWVPMFSKDLDPIPSSVMTASDFSNVFYPIASSDLTTSSGVVGIPLEYDALMLYINEDIFTKAGKTPPTTWDDLRIIARDLTVKDDQGFISQSGIALGRVENVDHWQEILGLMMLQNGVDLSSPTDKNTEDALKFFSIFSSVDGVWDATLPSSTQAFAGGKLAMYIAPSWRAFEIDLANPNLKYRTVPVPQLPKDSPSEKDITYATYWVEGVWTRSPQKAAAWDFLKFLSEKESLQKLYQSAAKVRGFGEPYPRVDMGNLLSSHEILGPLTTQVDGAQSWYLASRTFDGPTGINSLLSKYFEDAVNATANEANMEKTLETLGQGVSQVLSQYRLVK